MNESLGPRHHDALSEGTAARDSRAQQAHAMGMPRDEGCRGIPKVPQSVLPWLNAVVGLFICLYLNRTVRVYKDKAKRR